MNYIRNPIPHQEKEKLTSDLLMSFAKHITSHKSLTGCTVRVAIGVKDRLQLCCVQWPFGFTDSIFCTLDARYREHNSRPAMYSASLIATHVITEHFPELYGGCSNGYQVQVKGHKLIPGVYEYRPSAAGKPRRWFKVTSWEGFKV